MSSLRSWVVIAAAYLASVAASTGALAGAKDESAAEWLAPKWLNQWHDGLADKGLNFGATYIADNIGNVSGGVARGAIHFGRLDLSVDADLEKLFGWTGGRIYANTFGIYGRGLSRNYVHQPRNHQRDRGVARQAALQCLFRAKLFQQCSEYQGWPAGRGCRVLRQRDRRSVHQRDLRLAGDQGDQPSGRRPGTADRGARYSRQGCAFGQDHRLWCGVQRQCSTARRRRPAAARQSRPGVSRQ